MPIVSLILGFRYGNGVLLRMMVAYGEVCFCLKREEANTARERGVLTIVEHMTVGSNNKYHGELVFFFFFLIYKPCVYRCIYAISNLCGTVR